MSKESTKLNAREKSGTIHKWRHAAELLSSCCSRLSSVSFAMKSHNLVHLKTEWRNMQIAPLKDSTGNYFPLAVNHYPDLEKAFKFHLCVCECLLCLFRMIDQQYPINFIDPEIPFLPLIMIKALSTFRSLPHWIFHSPKPSLSQPFRSQIPGGGRGKSLLENIFVTTERNGRFNTYLNYVMHAPFVGCTY